MKTISIRPLSIDDTRNIVKWRNLPSVKRFLYSQDKLTPDSHIAYFESVVKAGKCAQFIIVLRKDEKEYDIGTIFIKNLDVKNRNGEFGIFIGEEIGRGKGYSLLATNLILEYGFKELGLHRISLSVMEDNIAAIKTYRKAGFVQEGILREEYLREGEYINIVLMSILKEEWNKKHDLTQNTE